MQVLFGRCSEGARDATKHIRRLRRTPLRMRRAIAAVVSLFPTFLVFVCAPDPIPTTSNRGLGGVLTWGRNHRGQLQVGDGASNRTTDQYSPTPVINLPLSPITNNKVVVVAAATGGAHTLISTVEGDVYAVGANEHGQLGVGDLFDRPTFTLIASFRNAPGALFDGKNFMASPGKQNVVKLAAGEHSSAAITGVDYSYVSSYYYYIYVSSY